MLAPQSTCVSLTCNSARVSVGLSPSHSCPRSRSCLSVYLHPACLQSHSRLLRAVWIFQNNSPPSRILLTRARSYSRIFVFCFRPVRARSRSCLRRVVPLPPSVRALVSSSAGGPFARIRALASPSPSGMHVYPSVCGPLARNRALASLSGNGVFRENSPAIERTAVWSAI